MRFRFGQFFPACSRIQRRGVIALFCLVILLQLAIVFYPTIQPRRESRDEIAWLALQPKIDSFKKAGKIKLRPVYKFNPNFITDFKGYSLGMSVAEIDRLHNFRKQNRYVNSAAEFQDVTKVSDSLLATMASNFKFPDWVNNRKTRPKWERKTFEKELVVPKDINTATAEDLIAVYGIGEALSARILKQRELLGGFVDMAQMSDVWGLHDDVVSNLRQHFKVASTPELKKIQINKASVKELGQFPYFRYPLSKAIVTYRSMNGEIKTEADLLSIPGFPIEKVGVIALYLEF